MADATQPVKAPTLSAMGATFAERKAAREGSTKQVDEPDTEDKSISSASTKKHAAKKPRT